MSRAKVLHHRCQLWCLHHRRALVFVLTCGECVFAVRYALERDILPAYLFTASMVKALFLGEHA